MKLAMDPPVPGIMPTKTPMTDPTMAAMRKPLISNHFGNMFVMTCALAVLFPCLLATWEKTSERANTPIKTGSKLKPLINRGMPNVKRSVPAMASMPTVEMSKPRHPARSPFPTFFPEELAIMDKPNMAREK